MRWITRYNVNFDVQMHTFGRRLGCMAYDCSKFSSRVRVTPKNENIKIVCSTFWHLGSVCWTKCVPENASIDKLNSLLILLEILFYDLAFINYIIGLFEYTNGVSGLIGISGIRHHLTENLTFHNTSKAVWFIVMSHKSFIGDGRTSARVINFFFRAQVCLFVNGE